MPEPLVTPIRIAVLADSDTRWKWGALTARRIAPQATLDGYLLRGRATPTARQLSEIGIEPEYLEEVSVAGFLAAVAGHAVPRRPGLIVLACVGGTVQALLHGLSRATAGEGRRPAVLTGYVGVVYENLLSGLLLRHGADLVLANSPHDGERFRAVYDAVGADATGVTESALPFLAGAGYEPGPVERGERPYRVVFAAQPSVPVTRADRAYLLDRAIRHARAHPDREVVLKLRSKPGEHTTHVEELPYQRLAGRSKARQPTNFRLTYGDMGALLDGTDLLVTVSSTAALESLHRGIPTAVLTDLGIREPLGNHYFAGSGCLASWDQLDQGYRPVPDPVWMAAQGVPVAACPDSFALVRARVGELVRRAGDTGLPPLAPYYSQGTAPGYLPGVLARHGLDLDGNPLSGGAATSGAGGLARQLLRRAARAGYRAGVQRAAPLIRRWGQL